MTEKEIQEVKRAHYRAEELNLLTSEFICSGKEGQDLFAQAMMRGNTGYFLDIGCNHGIHHNNTYSLERAGWKGLLFDILEPTAEQMLWARKSPYSLIDCTSEGFQNILNEEAPKEVDYISLDIDGETHNCLERVLRAGIKFKVMTFEHDRHKSGDARKAPAKKMLQDHGYHVLHENVMSDLKLHPETQKYLTVRRHKKRGFTVGGWHEWEDWWIHPDYFDKDVLEISTKGVGWSEALMATLDYMSKKYNYKKF